MYRFLFIIVILLFQTRIIQAQDPERKAMLGLKVHSVSGGLYVDSVVSASSAAWVGLQKQDLITHFNGQAVSQTEEFFRNAAEVRNHDTIRFAIKRNGRPLQLKAAAIARPLIEQKGADVRYGWLSALGCTVRKIVYVPKGKSKTPGILFIPGYNCGSIENYPDNFNGRMIEDWVNAGYTVYTVEKSGLGDSYLCKPCIEVDLQTDIDLFETALQDFSSLSEINKDQIFIWGHSMGGIIAPLIAQEKKVKGVMVFGTVYRPWSEFLPEMHRVQKPLLDSTGYAETEIFVRKMHQIYYEFFILKKSPEALHQNPDYRSLVETELEYVPGKTSMWGRHWRFWQQLDSIDLAKAWEKINTRVLVLHGESDFIQCSAVEPYLIHETVNRSHPGFSTLKIIPGIDHLMMKSKDFKEAARNMNEKAYLNGNFNPALAEETIRWMKAQLLK